MSWVFLWLVGMHCYYPFWWFLPHPVSSHLYADRYSEYSRGIFCRPPGSSMQLSSPAVLYYELELAPQTREPGGSPCVIAWKLSQGSKLTLFVSHLSGITLLQCPEFWFFFRHEGKSRQLPPSWPEAEKNPVCFDFIFLKRLWNTQQVSIEAETVSWINWV